jgi:hypothetical protein
MSEWLIRLVWPFPKNWTWKWFKIGRSLIGVKYPVNNELNLILSKSYGTFVTFVETHPFLVLTQAKQLACFLVNEALPRIGLEPTRLAAPEPKSGMSTNFTTWAKENSLIGRPV